MNTSNATTTAMTEEELSRSGLLATDVLRGAKPGNFDHLPLVADFILVPHTLQDGIRNPGGHKAGQTKGIPLGRDSAVRDKFLGAWRLVSWESTADGQTNFPFGKDAKGLLLYTPSGQMSVFLSRADRPAFARSVANAGTADEKVAAFDSCFAYAGTFEVAEGRVTHRLEHCTFPNWIGTAQLRFVRFQGDRLILETPPLPSDRGQAVSRLIWERTKP